MGAALKADPVRDGRNEEIAASPQHLLRHAAPIVAGAVAVLHGLMLRPKLVDDAWISFRVARNLAHGAGPVFNVGQRVEAISDPLWTALLAMASWMHLSLPATAWVLGLACLGVTAALTAASVQGWTGSPLVGLAAGLAAGLATNLVRASLAGLETGLFAVLLLVGLALVTSQRSHAGAALTLAALALTWTRFEGVIVAGVLVLAFGISGARIGPTRADAVRRAGPLLAVSGGFLLTELARRLYFGAWVPNSVTAKTDGTSLSSSLRRMIHPGFDYLGASVGLVGGLLILTGAFVALAVVAGRRRRDAFAVHIVTGFALVAVGASVALHNKGDWMPHARLIIPYFPLLVAVVAPAVWKVFQRGGVRLAIVTAMLWCLAVAVVLPGRASARAYRPFAVFGSQPFRNPGLIAGALLARTYRPGDVFVIGTLGAIGYGGGTTPLVDMYGLADRAIARLPIAAFSGGKFDASYLAGLEPTVLEDTNLPLLELVARLTGQAWCDIKSRALNRSLFLLVRCDAASRIGDPLAQRFGGRAQPLSGVNPSATPSPISPTPLRGGP